MLDEMTTLAAVGGLGTALLVFANLWLDRPPAPEEKPIRHERTGRRGGR
jgi:hypothetical protein